MEEPPSPVTGESPAERATRKAVEMTAAAKESAADKGSKAAKLKAEISGRGGVFKPADYDLLVAQEKETVTVEGIFEAIGYSTTKKTMYLQFSKNATSLETRGSVLLKDAADDLSESKLTPLLGKKIRLRGEVRMKADRPEIVIDKRSAIQEVK